MRLGAGGRGPVLALPPLGCATPPFPHLWQGVSTVPTPQGDKDGIRKLNKQTISQVPRKRLATWPAPVGWGSPELSLQVRRHQAWGGCQGPASRPQGALVSHVGPGTPGSEPYLSTVPLAWARSRCWKRPWTCESRRASRQPGALMETSQGGLSDAACSDLRAERLLRPGSHVGSGPGQKKLDSAPALAVPTGQGETRADVTVTSLCPDPARSCRMTQKGLGAGPLGGCAAE